MLLTDAKVLKFCRAFANGSSANIKFSKYQFSKTEQLGRFLFGSPNIFGSTIKEITSSPANSIKNSFLKKLKNKDPKEMNSNFFCKCRS